ncbi:hypothetical protein JKP88DRAFT_282967 [Tribonema minus]|uniref:GH18 domain-containing protein n=1 Tax=Tribonema minus TaxID=303371 RepID=A0A835YK78_9STRA|nr:hypothetical protein JKP88DRAFT_282967 [Tribonema minus]
MQVHIGAASLSAQDAAAVRALKAHMADILVGVELNLSKSSALSAQGHELTVDERRLLTQLGVKLAVGHGGAGGLDDAAQAPGLVLLVPIGSADFVRRHLEDKSGAAGDGAQFAQRCAALSSRLPLELSTGAATEWDRLTQWVTVLEKTMGLRLPGENCQWEQFDAAGTAPPALGAAALQQARLPPRTADPSGPEVGGGRAGFAALLSIFFCFVLKHLDLAGLPSSMPVKPALRARPVPPYYMGPHLFTLAGWVQGLNPRLDSSVADLEEDSPRSELNRATALLVETFASSAGHDALKALSDAGDPDFIRLKQQASAIREDSCQSASAPKSKISEAARICVCDPQAVFLHCQVLFEIDFWTYVADYAEADQQARSKQQHRRRAAASTAPHGAQSPASAAGGWNRRTLQEQAPGGTKPKLTCSETTGFDVLGVLKSASKDTFSCLFSGDPASCTGEGTAAAAATACIGLKCCHMPIPEVPILEVCGSLDVCLAFPRFDDSTQALQLCGLDLLGADVRPAVADVFAQAGAPVADTDTCALLQPVLADPAHTRALARVFLVKVKLSVCLALNSFFGTLIPDEEARKQVIAVIQGAASVLGVLLCAADATLTFYPLLGFLSFELTVGSGTMSAYVGVEAQLYDDAKDGLGLCGGLGGSCAAPGLEMCQICAGENRGVASFLWKMAYFGELHLTTLEVLKRDGFPSRRGCRRASALSGALGGPGGGGQPSDLELVWRRLGFFYAFGDAVNWVGGAVETVADAVVEGATAVGEAVVDAGEAVVDFVEDNIVDPIIDVTKQVLDAVSADVVVRWPDRAWQAKVLLVSFGGEGDPSARAWDSCGTCSLPPVPTEQPNAPPPQASDTPQPTPTTAQPAEATGQPTQTIEQPTETTAQPTSAPTSGAAAPDPNDSDTPQPTPASAQPAEATGQPTQTMEQPAKPTSAPTSGAAAPDPNDRSSSPTAQPTPSPTPVLSPWAPPPNDTRLVVHVASSLAEGSCSGDSAPLSAWDAASRATHVSFAFVAVGEDLLARMHSSDDDDTLRELQDIKEAHPSLKVILSIGGPDTAPDVFRAAVCNEESRAAFVKSADTTNYGCLLEDVRAALDSAGDDYILSVSVAATARLRHVHPSVVYPHVDFINLMTYDFHGGTIDPQEPLNAHTPVVDCTQPERCDIDVAVRWYLDAGVPAAALNLGLAFYGRTWSTRGGAADGPGPGGACTLRPGYLSRTEIRDAVNAGDVEHFAKRMAAGAPYGERGWVGFDDEGTLSQKVCYGAALGVGGFSVVGAEARGDAPLLRAVRESLEQRRLDACGEDSVPAC